MKQPEILGAGQYLSTDTAWGANCSVGHSSCVGYGDTSLPHTSIGNDVAIGAFCVVSRNVEISDSTRIDHYCRLESHVKIGPHSKVLYGAQIFSRARIGSYCIIGGDVSERVIVEDYVTFMGRMAHSHRNPNLDWDTTDEPSPIIKTGTVVGVDALLIGDVVVGPYSYVGAGEIVRHNIPPHSVYLNGRTTPIAAWRGLIRARVKR